MPVIAFVLATFFATASDRIVIQPPKPKKIDTIGLYHSGLSQFFLRNSNTPGTPDLDASLGTRGDIPFTGDFDADGTNDLGVLKNATGELLILKRRPFSPDVLISVQFIAQPGDLPIVGDWDGDGFDSLGIYRRTGDTPPIFGLSNGHVVDGTSLKAEIVFEFGGKEDLPIAGDWDGDGVDTVGVFRDRATFELVNDFGAGATETFVFGLSGDLPVAGDWDGDGRDGVGTYRADEHAFRLTNDSGLTTLTVRYKSLGDTPVAGDWDGVSSVTASSFKRRLTALASPVGTDVDTIGLFDAESTDFFLRNFNTEGGPNIVQPFFAHDEDLPFAGDFNADGEADVGVFHPPTGEFRILQPFPIFIARVPFVGQAGDRPVVGDWDGDGFDTIGIYRDDGINPPIFALTNAHIDTRGKVEITFEFGTTGDLPIAGDWDGDGIDTVGVYRPGRSTFRLVNDFGVGAEIEFNFGRRGGAPFAGDWDGDGDDGVGLYQLNDQLMQLTNDFGQTAVEFHYFSRGQLPVAGDWDGF